jgi:SAM-dependent methyltransferase
MSEACRLCGAQDTELFWRGDKRSHHRDFLRCGECDLIFVPDEFLLSPAQERARYELHENDPADEGYRAFLGMLVDEIVPLLTPGARGLDYGSGPTSALVQMLRERGFDMRGYDLYFSPDRDALVGSYDFITCTETVEHFREPLVEFDRMAGALAPGGTLGIMTDMPEGEWDAEQFARWQYTSEETHISFFSPATMSWLARRYGWRLRIPRPRVALFGNGGD